MPPEIAARIAAGRELRRRGKLTAAQAAALAELERRYAEPAPEGPPAGPRAEAPPSAFTAAADLTPQAAAERVAPAPETGGFGGAGAGRTWGDPREEGREYAANNLSPADAAAQGGTSFMFGVGVPLTAAQEYIQGKTGSAPERTWNESMEFARGVREGAYKAHPGAYRTGAVTGAVASAGAVRTALSRAPAAVQTVFSTQDGQTYRNLLKLAGIGATAASATTAAERGIDEVPAAAITGAIAGPVAAGAVALGASAISRLRPTATAIRVLARHLGESADAVADRYNRFIDVMGRAPRLAEIIRRETAEELGQVARSKVGVGAASTFKAAEEASAMARPNELRRLVEQGGRTSTVPAQEALLAPTARETSETLRRRVGGRPEVVSRSTEAVQVGRRDLRMDRVMAEIGGHEIPLTPDILERIQHPNVWSNLDAALRQRIAAVVQAAEEAGTAPTLNVHTFDAMRLELGKKAAARSEVGEYGSLRDRIRDYVVERVPEYGRALREYGRRSDVARGTATGVRALTMASRDLADAVRTAGGGTAGQAQRQGVRTAEQAGLRVGARIALADALSGPPDKVRAYMTRLARDPRLQANLREVLSESEIDELQRLAQRYGRRLRLRSGVEAGRQVMRQGQSGAFQDAVNEAAGTVEGRAGVRAGARGALADAAGESPTSAVTTARQLAQSPGLRRRIEAALGVPEAARLREVGQLSTTAAENLAATAPRATEAQLRAQAASQKTQEAIAGVVMAGGRASGAFRANFLNNVVQRFRMSEKAARRLAEMTTDPDQAPAVIAALRARGATPDAIAALYRDAAVAAGITVGQY